MLLRSFEKVIYKSGEKMNRREAITRVSLILGGTILGGDLFVSGCKSENKQVNDLLDASSVPLLNEISETILPQTSTPGAKAANVGQFIVTMVNDCYSPADRAIFIKGLWTIDDKSKADFGDGYMQISANQRAQLLTKLDVEQKNYTKTMKENSSNHYFRMIKELTLLGYFTSEIGCTKALRYVPVPGKYIGCIPYKKGEKAWALS
jgi:hypothetical protein